MIDYTARDAILDRALSTAQLRFPEACPAQHAAFANSVGYLTTGWSGGFGGPSVREHAACRKFGSRGPLEDGLWPEEEAHRLLLEESGLIFGPLAEAHREAWRCEVCFDDDPADLVELNFP